ncbi:pyridoxamine 5'-phosphate oxidase family protein [Paenibacillus aquistagni]|uniref:Pyridoxamine 5'-phosphate oxidase N-terminal domain-containing protein n=1 Tax=Paenibacillus aquistagni TaxID=1852522 RepID=A0A1X7J0F2_9BACL|nr:pyridoxamine 5'-phosphate oxidase family protein [Paenibacillus aquistagni]SMG20574.1 hypothetical protein SAMN06295960_1040 [Paenibacillus aquistagni]
MSPFKDMITKESELRALLGHPSPIAIDKSIEELDEHCVDYIKRSPMCFISTSNHSGTCDVSPRGDAPGFVHVLDSKHLIIPERPGNRRFDSILNMLDNPHIGILFIIPRLDETLRINGKACIVSDSDLLDQMEVRGKSPLIGIGVEVEECFIHCGKAFKRSNLWNVEHWHDPSELPNASKMIAAHAKEQPDKVHASLMETYEKRLY